MQAIDEYCGEVYYIGATLRDPGTPCSLKSTLRVDMVKTMAIGSVFMVMARYMVYNRYYLFKNYVNSVFLGSSLGIGYSPLFLGPKIDRFRLNLLLERDESAS